MTTGDRPPAHGYRCGSLEDQACPQKSHTDSTCVTLLKRHNHGHRAQQGLAGSKVVRGLGKASPCEGCVFWGKCYNSKWYSAQEASTAAHSCICTTVLAQQTAESHGYLWLRQRRSLFEEPGVEELRMERVTAGRWPSASTLESSNMLCANLGQQGHQQALNEDWLSFTQ